MALLWGRFCSEVIYNKMFVDVTVFVTDCPPVNILTVPETTHPRKANISLFLPPEDARHLDHPHGTVLLLAKRWLL